MIDITISKPDKSETKPNQPTIKQNTTKSFNVTLLLLISLVWVVYDTSYWKKFIPDRIIPSESAAQILFVTSDEMSNGQGQVAISQRLEKFCDEQDIEKRRLEVNQDVSNAESWLQDMTELGYGQSPCVVFRSISGKIDIIPIPESIESMMDELKERL